MQAYLLENLRDIQTPESIGWWPLAFGWWVLLGLVICLILSLIIWRYQHWKQNAYRRQSLSVADHLLKKYKSDADSVFYVEHANQLLKRVMLRLHRPALAKAESTLADLSGDRWVDALNEQASTPFSEDAKDVLANQLYRPEPDVNVAEFHQELLRWLQTHQRLPTFRRSLDAANTGNLAR